MEEKKGNSYIISFLLILFILGAGYISYNLFAKSQPIPSSSQPVAPIEISVSPQTQTPTIVLSNYVSYKGKTGKNALQLLKEKATVEQDSSGLVVAINGRSANLSKNEYWAFYVNGKLSTVGPAEYQTKDEDSIEWKIENF